MLEKGMKYFHFNSKNSEPASLMPFWRLLLTLNMLHTFLFFSTVDFKKVNVCWVVLCKCLGCILGPYLTTDSIFWCKLIKKIIFTRNHFCNSRKKKNRKRRENKEYKKKIIILCKGIS